MAILDARSFSPSGAHAGTLADPWPGISITNAIAATSSGDTVSVVDGYWAFSSGPVPSAVTTPYTILGQSLNAILYFTNDGQLFLGSGGAPANLTFTISNLTFDSSNKNVSTLYALRAVGLKNCTFSNNKVIGHPNNSVPAILTEGSDGTMNYFTNNTVISTTTGGGQLQQVAAFGSANSNMTISNNTFDSCNLLFIGISNALIKSNTVINATLGNICTMLTCGRDDPANPITNVTIDSNILDAGSSNGAGIYGIPNDPPLGSNIDGLIITNNFVRGTAPAIVLQTNTESNFHDNTLIKDHKTNVTIRRNQLIATNSAQNCTIDIRGGAGSTGPILVECNTMVNGISGGAGAIVTDGNTLSATIQNNNLNGATNPCDQLVRYTAFSM